MTMLAWGVIGIAICAGVSFGTIYVLLREAKCAFPLRDEVYRSQSVWYWRILDRHGNVVANGGEPYLHAHEAKKAVRLVHIPAFAE
jgi:hypothetical protein